MLLNFSSRTSAAGVAALALAAITGCSSTKQKVGLADVDSLMTRVEKVHMETELSKEAVYDAVLKMQPIFAANFDGDASEAFAAFAEATVACQSQANKLRTHVAPMRSAADTVFDEWTVKLEDFTSQSMRQRSLLRLEATRERYTEVQEAAVAAQEAFDDLNSGMRDIVLFLGHDFNMDAVQEITEEAVTIRDQARSLGMVFDDCMQAAEDYIATAGLRSGQAAGPSLPGEE
ncbi:MAG: DUF2959 family protein [Planctomycetota bacterium]